MESKTAAEIILRQAVAGALSDVRQEFERATEKHGSPMLSPHEMIAIIGEEFGEACKAMVQAHHGETENDSEKWAEFRNELIQTAAMCIKAIAYFDTGRFELYFPERRRVKKHFHGNPNDQTKN